MNKLSAIDVEKQLMIDDESHVVRRMPVQDRSALRFAKILDTTATLIDEQGYAGMTITDIARRSSMTSAAVYRYFDEMHSVARGLAERNRDRFIERVTKALSREGIDWPDALRLVVDSYADMFRNEPGFRWLRLGDELERNRITDVPGARFIVAQLVAELFIERYEVDYRPDLVSHVEVMIEFCDALIARAFLVDPTGEDFFLDECADLLVSYLGNYLAQPYDKTLKRPSA